MDIKNFSQNNLHPKSSDENAPNWIFIVDTLNFCFWTPNSLSKWTVENETGYFGLCAAINRAITDGIDITNPEYYSNIKIEELREILKSDDNSIMVPLLKERLNCLKEVGNKLLSCYDGKFENVIKKCNNSAEKLLQLIIEEFPCFRDEAEFDGERVGIYKRAQILVGDIWACYKGDGLGKFDDIDKITMFADYRVPQVLVHFGALEYSKELMEILNSGIIFLNVSSIKKPFNFFIKSSYKPKIIYEFCELTLHFNT